MPPAKSPSASIMLFCLQLHRGRAAIRELLNRGHAAGLIPEVKELEFVAG